MSAKEELAIKWVEASGLCWNDVLGSWQYATNDRVLEVGCGDYRFGTADAFKITLENGSRFENMQRHFPAILDFSNGLSLLGKADADQLIAAISAGRPARGRDESWECPCCGTGFGHAYNDE